MLFVSVNVHYISQGTQKSFAHIPGRSPGLGLEDSDCSKLGSMCDVRTWMEREIR